MRGSGIINEKTKQNKEKEPLHERYTKNNELVKKEREKKKKGVKSVFQTIIEKIKYQVPIPEKIALITTVSHTQKIVGEKKSNYAWRKQIL